MVSAATVDPVGPDDVEAFWRAAGVPFGEAPDDEQLAFQQALTEPDRTFAVRDRGRMVAMGAAQSLDVSLPGGAVTPMAGVSLLGVAPTHRRRGLGRSVMGRLHDQARQRGEPLVGLWAAEGGIYRNYGYGVAAHTAVVDLHPGVRWRPELGVGASPLQLVELDDAVALAQSLTERIRTRVAGVPCLSATRLRRHLFHDPPAWREGYGARAYVAAEDGRGLASYRVKVDWEPTGPQGHARADWLMAADADTEARLWRYLTDLDLVSSVQVIGRPADDPVPLRAVDARTVGVRVTDGLWLRVLDPPAVLSARTYAAAGRVVVDVADDDGYAAGRYALATEDGDGAAQPAPPGALADVALPVDALGALVLGGARPTRLARARLATEHTPGALWRLERMLATERAPWCPFVVE